MSRFQIKAPLFEMTEKLLNAPSHPVKCQGFLPIEAITDHKKVAAPAPFALDDLVGEV
jgi:hypothetical protein